MLKRYLLGQTSGIKWWKQWDFTSDDWDFRWFSWPEWALVSSLTSYFWLIYSYPGASHVLFFVCCWFPTLELVTILSKIHGSPDSLSFINAAAFPSSPIWAPIFLRNTYLGLQFDDRIYNLLLVILWCYIRTYGVITMVISIGIHPNRSPWYFIISPVLWVKISIVLYTLWLFNIAMENGPVIDGLPIKNDDFPWPLIATYQVVN